MNSVDIPLLPRLVRWVGVLAVVGIIVHYSLITVPPEPPSKPSLWDKQLHFAAYATFAFALAYATVDYRDHPWRRGVAVFCLAVGFGMCIELLQGMLSYRYFGWGDMLANMLGAALVALWFPIERQIRYVPVWTNGTAVSRN